MDEWQDFKCRFASRGELLWLRVGCCRTSKIRVEGMEEIDQGKVNDAIHECLDRCYRKNAALVELALFLDELRSGEGWRAGEIHEVEFALLTLLNGVLT